MSPSIRKIDLTNQMSLKLKKKSCGHTESSSMRKEAFSYLISTKSLQNTSRGVIELLKNFVFEWMVMTFSIILLWALYPSMTIHHEQCIFIKYMPKVITDHTKNVELYINLTRCSWNHCWMETCTWSAFFFFYNTI